MSAPEHLPLDRRSVTPEVAGLCTSLLRREAVSGSGGYLLRDFAGPSPSWVRGSPSGQWFPAEVWADRRGCLPCGWRRRDSPLPFELVTRVAAVTGEVAPKPSAACT
jgi:hypothetical protein